MFAHPTYLLGSFAGGSIVRALTALVEPGGVFELRIPKVGRAGTVSGYFNDLSMAARSAARWSGRAAGVYFTINPLNPALLARALNRMVEHAEHTTADANVLARRWLYVDVDPDRPAGICATDAEHEAALARARELRDFLVDQGVPANAILLADSGNGGSLYVRIDLPNDQGQDALVNGALTALDSLFSDSVAAVDRAVGNAARIARVPGTLNAKGDSTAERPHRIARLLDVPDSFGVCPRDVLEQISALAPAPEGQARQAAGGQPFSGPVFDFDAWLARSGLTVSRQKPVRNGTLYELATCPWNPDHTRTASITRLSSGALAARCFHDSCAGRCWRDLRDMVEGGDRLVRHQPAPPRGNGHSIEPSPTPVLTFVTAAELWVKTPELPDWVVRGLLARTCITDVSAKIKAGKTTFIMAMIKAILTGNPFLGFRTVVCPVLYMTEEREQTVREVLGRVGIEAHHNLHIVFRHSLPSGLTWERTVSLVTQKALAVGAGVVVIDTLTRWAGVQDENDAAEASRAMTPLDQAAGAGLAIVTVRHDRKSGGEIGDSARGSSAYGGGADILLALRRARVEGHENRREVEAVGRFDATPEKLVIEWADGEYVALGDRNAVEQREARARVWDILPASDQAPGITLSDLLDRTGAKRSTLQRVLEALGREGAVTKHAGAGKTKRGFGYTLAGNDVPTIEDDPGHITSGHVSEDHVPNDVPRGTYPGQLIPAFAPEIDVPRVNLYGGQLISDGDNSPDVEV